MWKQLMGHDDAPRKIDVAVYSAAAVVAVLKAVDKIMTYRSINQGAK